MARFEAVHQTLQMFRGSQRFSIAIRNGDPTKDLLVDFPNDTTRDCSDLRVMLSSLGVEVARG